MCFEVSALAPSDSFGSNKFGSDGTETNLAAHTGSDVKHSNILAYVVKINFNTMPFLLHYVYKFEVISNSCDSPCRE